jgi:hypothetical protein
VLALQSLATMGSDISLTDSRFRTCGPDDRVMVNKVILCALLPCFAEPIDIVYSRFQMTGGQLGGVVTDGGVLDPVVRSWDDARGERDFKAAHS